MSQDFFNGISREGIVRSVTTIIVTSSFLEKVQRDGVPKDNTVDLAIKSLDTSAAILMQALGLRSDEMVSFSEELVKKANHGK